MLTRRMAAPMMRRGGRRMRQMQELRAENARLRAQVGRMRQALQYLTHGVWDEVGGILDCDDLDEPHGAANDTPGSQPEPYDTKSPKSITSAEVGE